jgi:chorismate mutase
MTDIIEDRGRGFLIEIGEELSRLRADLAQRTAERDALAAEVAALKAKADPLAEMWAALEEYQPFANRDGHGESWAKMCRERTEGAALAAASAAAADAAWAAAWAAGRAAPRDAASAAARAADSVDAIRRAKEVQR